MKITGTTCLSHLLYLFSRPELIKATNSIKFDRPLYEHEGMAGYIEVEYEIDVKDILIFGKVWDNYFYLTDEQRKHFYKLALHGSDKCHQN